MPHKQLLDPIPIGLHGFSAKNGDMVCQLEEKRVETICSYIQHSVLLIQTIGYSSVST